MFKFYKKLNQVEKIVVTFLAIIVLLSGYKVVQAFYNEHSEVQPISGGIYTEGAVGKIELINPLFARQGSVTHDLTQLVFSGLTKYDPITGDIVPDLAEFKLSSDEKTYTFVIKEGAVWHDGMPVTSDDVLFTYNQVIQNPAFNGLILTYNDYAGIKVAKKDERTVDFLLEKPDSFFLVKTMTGLLPHHLLSNAPVETLEQHFFNQFPTGSGPYKLTSISPFDDYAEVSLEAFADYYGEKPNIGTILIRVFPTFKELLKNQTDLMGIRSVPEESADKILEKEKFALQYYHLPQYVALFINTESPKLKNAKTRLGLQLGTNKDSIMEAIGQSERIDTPILEIDQANWMNQFSVKNANGALFETEWQLPKDEDELEETEEEVVEEVELTLEEKIEQGDTDDVTFINGPNEGHDFKTTDTKVTITGTAPPKTKSIRVNDYELNKYVPGDPGWTYIASTEFENLNKGENLFIVYATNFAEEETVIDAITVTYGDSVTFSEEEKEERNLENEAAPILEVRQNEEGEPLALKLITSQTPEVYQTIAAMVQEQWKKIGVEVEIEVLENGAFQERFSQRDYDLLLFGQNLGYNLDAYPYWHSSQAKEGGFNLSQFKNFIVDSLLEKARLEHDEDDRKETLADIQEIISKEVPAIFLYTPTYRFALSPKIQNATLNNLATTSDRFANIEHWFARVDRKLKEGVNPLTFLGWLLKQF